MDFGTPIAVTLPGQDWLLTHMASDYHRRRLGDMVVVRLTHKFAEMIDDVDLSQCSVGDTAAFSGHDARLLIAEGWAEAVAERRSTYRPSVHSVAAERADVTPPDLVQLIRLPGPGRRRRIP